MTTQLITVSNHFFFVFFVGIPSAAHAQFNITGGLLSKRLKTAMMEQS
jgi:hypothetical protein